MQTVASKEGKPITRNQLRSELRKHLSDGGDLFIRNMSFRHKAAKRRCTVLSFQVLSRLSGKKIPAIIPPTTIPFPITDHVLPQDLAGSDEFEKLLNKGLIEVVETNEALEILSHDENRERMKAAMARIGKNDILIDLDLTVEDAVEGGKKISFEEQESYTPSSRVAAIVSRVSEGTLTSKAASFEMLDMMATGAVGPADLDYIKREVETLKGDHVDELKKLSAWASEKRKNYG